MEKCTLRIKSGGKIQMPPILEGIQWETARKGEAGKLTFTCIKTPKLSFNEGDEVSFHYGDTNVFHGFVFEKSRNKDHHIRVTCYDQLRYLKNKTSYCLNYVSADDVLLLIANDFKLKVGNLPHTGYVIPRFEQMNLSLFDMILNAIDETVLATGNLYYLYDDFGTMRLKNIKDSTLNVMIDAGTAEDFDYSTSIDKNTYNRIVITDSEDKESGKYTHADDPKTQGQWGILQHFQSIKNGAQATTLAKKMLEFYNKKSSSLTIKKQFGDIRVRAGTGVYLNLNLGDKIARQRMLVEKAVHTFDNCNHYMDLTLIGCDTFYD